MTAALRLPAHLRKEGCRLLHQQCWLWGQDVRRSEGNLLLEAGFARVRPPEGVVGCSQYTLRLPEGRSVRVWGFGICFTGEHTVYVNRYGFEPRAVDLQGDLWQAIALPQGQAAPDASALLEAVRWMAGYEHEVLRQHGTGYRWRCLTQWKGRAVSPALLPDRWLALRDGLSALQARQAMCRVVPGEVAINGSRALPSTARRHPPPMQVVPRRRRAHPVAS